MEIPLELSESGILLSVGVSAPPNYVTRSNPPVTIKGLLDTGSDRSYITSTYAEITGMPPIGFVRVHRAGSVHSFQMEYLARVKVGGHLIDQSWRNLPLIEIEPATEGVSFILGMDLIGRFILHVDGPAGTGYLSDR